MRKRSFAASVSFLIGGGSEACSSGMTGVPSATRFYIGDVSDNGCTKQGKRRSIGRVVPATAVAVVSDP